MMPEDENHEEKGTDKPWWAEAMREISMTGLATVFLTEDAVRKYLKERKLPKELMGLFLDGVSKRKEDVYALFAKEFGKVMAKVDLSREMEHFLERHNVHFEAKISFEKKEPTVQSSKTTIEEKEEKKDA